MIGNQVSRYRITAKIGEGGMGEVYLAEDPELSRKVALKFLPERLLSDDAALARFRREAQAAAALDHAHIVTIYEIGTFESRPFLVLAHVEGESLRQVIDRGDLDVERALDLAIEIGEGLTAAHRAGVVHRDVKPDNVIVDTHGHAKILDFGLAKLADTTRITAEQSTMGTVGYMSPEQVRGADVDARSDIFSLGVVLYEMLAGRRPFRGEDQGAVLHAITSATPHPLARYLEDASDELQRVVSKALSKDPQSRYQSVADLVVDLKSCRAASSSTMELPASGKSGPSLGDFWRALRPAMPWILGAAGLVVAFLAGRSLSGGGPAESRSPEAVVRFTVGLPEDEQLTDPQSGGDVALSPDGRHLAFVVGIGNERAVWVRSMDSTQPRKLPGTERARNPFWSPDSRAIAYFTDSELRVTTIDGGPPRAVCPVDYGRGGAWLADETIVFAPDVNTGIWKVNAVGGEATPLTQLDPARKEKSHRWPAALPDGRHFLYFAWSNRAEDNAIFLGDLRTAETEYLLPASSRPVVDPQGHILYVASTGLMAVRFDVQNLEARGDPFRVATDVDDSDLLESAFGPVAVSSDGTLAYVTLEGDEVALVPDLVRYDRNGEHGPVLAPALRDPALSPDGRLVAGNRNDPEDGTWSLWVVDLEQGTDKRFVFESSQNWLPVWSPDSRQIAFASDRNGRASDLYVKAADGRSTEELVLSSDAGLLPASWSPDGRWLLYERHDPTESTDLWVVPMAEEGEPEVYVQGAGNEIQGEFSPDGKWVAYASDESGQYEIYVQPFPATGGKWLLSSGGGTQPRWQSDGRRLFYLAASDEIMAVDVQTESGVVAAGPPRSLFRIPNPCCDGMNTDEFDVAPDGQSFYATVNRTTSGAPVRRSILVVSGWAREFRD